ncbi:MAG: GlsB/YeaQ/YmgE family stress response membrane protein, partial [Tepidiformaceae bacterium]
MGLIVTIGVGIIGAFVGGFLGSLLGFGGITGFNIGSLVIAIVGAIVFLAIWRAVSGGGRRHAV